MTNLNAYLETRQLSEEASKVCDDLLPWTVSSRLDELHISKALPIDVVEVESFERQIEIVRDANSFTLIWDHALGSGPNKGVPKAA